MLTGRPPFLKAPCCRSCCSTRRSASRRAAVPAGVAGGVCRVLRRTLAKDPAPLRRTGEMVATSCCWPRRRHRSADAVGKTWTTPRRPVATFFWRHFPWRRPWRPWVGCAAVICSGRRRRARNRCRRCRSPNRRETATPPADERTDLCRPRDATSPVGTERPQNHCRPRSPAEQGLRRKARATPPARGGDSAHGSIEWGSSAAGLPWTPAGR